MSNLTKKDIATFGKVLCELGMAIEDNPAILLQILDPDNSFKKINLPDEQISDAAKNINIFEAYKEKKKSDIEEDLLRFNKNELKFIIKTFSLGATRLNSVEKLAEFISDQIIKRTKDVFINQE